ncbi:MAG: hypothetical protein JEZ14_25280, partial [Marinilabiliaceae bacterium]|nr:hypothetical protein [Marinilabiliaceae bacterium]
LNTVDGRNVLQNTRNSNEDFETFEIYKGSSETKSKSVLKTNRYSYTPEELEMLREISNAY